MNKRRIVACASIIMVLCMMLVVSVQPAKAQFVIASWDFPVDEYGQGILSVFVYENSTGDWVEIPESKFDPEDSGEAEVNGSIALKIGVFFVLNKTFFGLTDIEEGKNIVRGSIEMSCLGETVFSQQNMTYYDWGVYYETAWWIGYEAVINFILVAGEIYTVVVTYEIFY